MFHVYETNKSEIENVERDFFFTKEKRGNISFYISCIKQEGNLEESESGAVCAPWNRGPVGFGYGLR